jgi:hypothetical protein
VTKSNATKKATSAAHPSAGRRIVPSRRRCRLQLRVCRRRDPPVGHGIVSEAHHQNAYQIVEVGLSRLTRESHSDFARLDVRLSVFTSTT